jgi:hypothetical protein
MNRNGLTYSAWLDRALARVIFAGGFDDDEVPLVRAAWERGEDPDAWREEWLAWHSLTGAS